MNLKHCFDNNKSGDLLALIAGLLTPLAFAPFHIFPLIIFTIACLLALWRKASQKRAAWRGFLFGLGCFGIGASWVYVSLQQFGDIAPSIAIALTAVFVMYLALYPCLTGYCLQRFFPENMAAKYFCAFPFFWLLFDWIRSWFFSGFPWLLPGYSQTYSPLEGYASLLSVYGVTIAILYSSALIVYAWLGRKERRITCLIIFILIWLIGGVLSFIPWTHTTGKPMTTSLIQGDIPQSIKWSPKHLSLSIERYQSLTEKNWGSQLIIWPETAIPLPSSYLKDFFAELNKQALAHNSTLIVGAPVPSANPNQFYNGMLVFGKGSGHYYKRRLVPFGEMVPNVMLAKKMYAILQLPKPNLLEGPYQQPDLIAQGVKIAPFICYEIVFPQQVRQFSVNSNFLLTISDDTWFGHSIAAWQHLQMAQMRAIETGRYVVFVSNSGITAIINASGRVVSRIPPFKVAVLHGKIQPMAGKTPWQRIGFSAILIFMVLILLIAIRAKDNFYKRLKSV